MRVRNVVNKMENPTDYVVCVNSPSSILSKKLRDSEVSRLEELKASLQSQTDLVLDKIKNDTQEWVEEIQKRSHVEMIRIMNASMNLITQFEEVISSHSCNKDSPNAVSRGLYRNQLEIFRELEQCIEHKGFFDYKGVSHEPKVVINVPYLENVQRIALKFKEKHRHHPPPEIHVKTKTHSFSENDANLETKFGYFVDHNQKKLVKVNCESNQAITTDIDLTSAWAGICRLPNNSYFQLGGALYPKKETCDYYIINEYHMEKRTMQPIELGNHQTCVYHLGSVFLFGGIREQAPSNQAFRFDLNEHTWHQLKSLPFPTGFNNSLVIGDTIALTGYHLNALYAYISDDDEYYYLTDLPSREYKVLYSAFEKIFLLCAGHAYESHVSNLQQWKSIAKIPKTLSSLLGPPARHGMTVFFVTSQGDLWHHNLRTNEITQQKLVYN